MEILYKHADELVRGYVAARVILDIDDVREFFSKARYCIEEYAIIRANSGFSRAYCIGYVIGRAEQDRAANE